MLALMLSPSAVTSMLGGSQAGIIVGRLDAIEKIRKNPLMRALRVGKLTIAALEATLRLHLNEKDLTEKLPMLQRYTRSISELREIAEKLANHLRQIFRDTIQVTVEKSAAQIGSGSLPVDTLPSLAISLHAPQIPADTLAAYFRAQPIPVIGRVQDERFRLDVRTVLGKESVWIVEAAEGVMEKLQAELDHSNLEGTGYYATCHHRHRWTR